MAVVATTLGEFPGTAVISFFMPLHSTTKKGIIEEEMHRYKYGQLHSGTGKRKVKSRKQAIAIALSEARKHGR